MDFINLPKFHPDEIEARRIYEYYFYIGLLCVLFAMVCFITYFSLGLKKLHPMKIIINILFLEFLSSMKYFITFSIYKLTGDNLKYTPFHGRDFGFLNTNCKMEGFTSYFLFICMIFWNFSWSYDIYYVVTHPTQPNYGLVYYYKVFTYFFGCLFALAVFYPSMDIFTDTTMFICSIKNGVIYNIFINMFLILVILVNIFVIIKYTRKVFLFEVNENTRAIKKIIKVHLFFSILWTVLHCSNFVFVFINSDDIKFVHGIIEVSCPLAIYITFMFALCINVRRRKRRYTLLTEIEENRIKQIRRDTRIRLERAKRKKTLVDSFMMFNMKSIDSDGGRFLNPEDRAFDIEPQFGFWEISDNFKEVLRTELVQYIIKAFDKIFAMYAREEDKRHSSIAIPKLKQLPMASTAFQNPPKINCWKKFTDKLFAKPDEAAENYEYDK